MTKRKCKPYRQPIGIQQVDESAKVAQVKDSKASKKAFGKGFCKGRASLTEHENSPI